MTNAEMETMLLSWLEKYRSWSYSELTASVEREDRTGDCLESGEGLAADGTKYFIELNTFWDDRPQGNVRVIGALEVFPQKSILGVVPVRISEMCLSFIMAPDGAFVGE